MAEAFHDAKIESKGNLTDKFKATFAALQERDAEETDTLDTMMKSIGGEVKKDDYRQVANEFRNRM